VCVCVCVCVYYIYILYNIQVLSEVNDAYGKQNEKIKDNTCRAINLIQEGRVDEGK
jgi:hypothetical protein